jgi:hypothetical protein
LNLKILKKKKRILDLGLDFGWISWIFGFFGFMYIFWIYVYFLDLCIFFGGFGFPIQIQKPNFFGSQPLPITLTDLIRKKRLNSKILKILVLFPNTEICFNLVFPKLNASTVSFSPKSDSIGDNFSLAYGFDLKNMHALTNKISNFYPTVLKYKINWTKAETNESPFRKQ